MKKTSLQSLSVAAITAAGLLLAGCSDDPPNSRYHYLRGAGELAVSPAPADTLCADPGPNFSGDGFDPVETCKRTQKFVLRWERPEDTVDFRGYALYLDTMPDGKSWKAIQGRNSEADLLIPGHSQAKDGLVFFFYDGKVRPPGIAASRRPDTVKAGEARIFGLDTSGRLEEERQRFVFALATRHDGGTPGQPQYTYIITGDKFAPAVFKPFITVKARSLDIDWARPTDPTSFFDPAADTGIIREYELSVRLHGKFQAARSAAFKPSVRYFAGGEDRSAAVRESVITTEDGDVGRVWRLPDSARARRGAPAGVDSIRVEVLGLQPKDSILVDLFARDSAGNMNDRAMPNVTVITTDTTRPTTPEIAAIDSLTTRNGFVVRWTASKDSTDLDGDGVLEPGAGPNAGIRSYRLIRSPLLDSGSGSGAVDRRDSVIRISQANADDTVFHDTVRFLPPGRTYQVIVTAVDSSGFVSEADTVRVTTDSIRFAGADSGLACPPGMVPIPASRFLLGEAGPSAADRKDEGGGRAIAMGSFCIEPYEHRDSLGRFATRVTWQEADSTCRALSPGDSTQLCSEVEWERACEGFDYQQPHPHGIQSERTPAILQASCNQATGDSAMAMSFELRNPLCLTNEGVYDMAGNLSEWVRDPYNPGAYATLTDSVLAYGHTFPGSGDYAGVHSIRGGNFLRPGVTVSAAQGLARCSNRDFPMQVRPLTKPECVDADERRVAVIYGEGVANVKCFPVADLEGQAVTDMIPDRKDSTLVRYFLEGVSDSRTFAIPPDTAFKGRKPLEVRFTTPSLLEVVFERVGSPRDTAVDTLDARELRDTSQALLERILARESPSPAWAPRKSGGRIEARRLYAHVITGSKLAKPYFASRSIGFRCCSKPRAPDPGTTVAGGP